MSILTDEEIDAVFDRLRGETFEQALRSIDFARAIEAAVIAKIGEPVAWRDKDLCILHEEERETPVTTLVRMGWMGWMPLYRLPEDLK
jgi:hypothetical protein